jgi:PPM family protein phosphatase
MELRAGWATNPGRVRGLNEDSVLVADPLYLVADGMGGHAAGEVASRIAIETMRDVLGPRTVEGPLTVDDVVGAVETANMAIVIEADADASQRGMGTTLTGVAAVEGDALLVVNVGDSRTYLLHDGALTMVTRDHTYVEELLAAGEITAEQARVHPHRHVITHALGIEPGTLVDSWTFAATLGDRYLVCSDGLTNEVDDPTIAEVLRDEADPQVAADTLVRLANDFGGRDNITVVVVHVDAGATSDERAVGGWLGDDVDPFDTSPPPPPERPPDAVEPAPPPPGRHRRSAVAAIVFVLAVVGVLFAGVLAIQAAGHRGYFIAFDETGTVSIYSGKPDGVLWVDPTLHSSCPVHRDELATTWVDRVEEQPTFTSSEAAQQWCVENLLTNPDAIPALTTTTPPTTTTAPTTTTTTTPTTTTPPTTIAVAPTTPATAVP